MNELTDKILTAAAIPVLILVGIGTAYLIIQFRKLDAEIKKELKQEDPNDESID